MGVIFTPKAFDFGTSTILNRWLIAGRVSTIWAHVGPAFVCAIAALSAALRLILSLLATCNRASSELAIRTHP
jgi:hypothetical protein